MVFWWGKIQFFKIIRLKISKILKFCSLRDVFNFLLTKFQYNHACNLKFSRCSILIILQENKESNSHRLIQKPEVLLQNRNKMKTLWSQSVFYEFHCVITFDKQMLSIWNFLYKLYAGNTTASWRIR